MSRDLTELLSEAVPSEVGGPDLDLIESRVLRRRWTTGAAAALAILAVVVGVSQLVGGQPDIPVIEQDDGEVDQTIDIVDDDADASGADLCNWFNGTQWVSSLGRTGAFDRGCGETLELDLAGEDRLSGRVLPASETDVDWRGGFFAVASDRAIGGSYDPASYEQSGAPRMSILVDGQQVATRAVDQSGPVAFDSDGTLWAWTGSGVAGLRRDGTTVDHEVATPPVPPHELPDWMREPGVTTQLRITGTDVSVVFTTEADRDWAHVVSVVGRDPLVGAHTVDSPLPDFGPDWLSDTADILAFTGDSVLTPGLLASGSILGTARVELDWPSPPDRNLDDMPAAEQSQLVADTSASLLWVEDYDASFLVVHRGDGLAAAALVAGSPRSLSVSPDGAVHLVSRPGPTTVPTVTTLLDADLQPQHCRTPSSDAQVVDGVDLDGDGTPDQVTLHGDGEIMACLASGPVSALSTFPPAFSEYPQTLEPVDLGGHDGVAVTMDTDEHDLVFLLRVVDDALGALGMTGGGRVFPSDWQALIPINRGWDFRVGSGTWSGQAQHETAFGCRPAPSPESDFEVLQLRRWEDGAVQADLYAGFDGIDFATPSGPLPDDVVGFDLYVDSWGMNGGGLGTASPFQEDPPTPPANPTLGRAPFEDTLPGVELDQLLRDLGFTPACATEE